ncbi:MAG: transposase [Gemmatimonadaceae bacterium]
MARHYRAGELTAVRIPSEAEERVRDVVRCRETFQREILKSRHYILKGFARRGFVCRDGTNWCTPHLRWLEHVTTEHSPLAPADRLVFRECHALLQYKLQRREDLDREIDRLAELPTLAPMVQRLQCFRRIALQGAMVLATEIVDWRRFARPTQLAAYLGLVSREDASGHRERKGSITNAGNSHCRHVLVQAAWNYHHRPAVSADLKRRQAGQPPAVIAHASKAQQRLHQRYTHLAYRKQPQIAAVAVARERVGLLWAVMQDCPGATSAEATGYARSNRLSFLLDQACGLRLEVRALARALCGSLKQGSDIPVPRMRELPTNPFLAALPEGSGNRRISAGLPVDATAGPRRSSAIEVLS